MLNLKALGPVFESLGLIKSCLWLYELMMSALGTRDRQITIICWLVFQVEIGERLFTKSHCHKAVRQRELDQDTRYTAMFFAYVSMGEYTYALKCR